MTSRALSFGAAAQAYERFRPGYPRELVDLVLDYAGRPVASALEIGAGTGKATRAFVAAGVQVLATEPDAAMLAELQRQVPDVVTINAPFETVPLEQQFDLVFAAAAMHWTEPAGRWERVAALLVPGGVFASFGGPLELADAAVRAEVERARAAFLDSDDVPSPDGTDERAALQWPGTELAASPLFDDVRQEHLERRYRLAAEAYVHHLRTISAYLQLPPDSRERALSGVRSVLPDEVEINADLTVHLARLR